MELKPLEPADAAPADDNGNANRLVLGGALMGRGWGRNERGEVTSE